MKIPPLLKGQKALVTGGSSGIGQGIALALAESGADVAINYAANEKGAQATAQQCAAFGVKTMIVQADVSQEDQVVRMFKEVKQQFCSLDILINNAGLQKDAPLDQMSLSQWNKVIGINLTGQFLCAREAIKEFKHKGIQSNISASAGKIICISSVHEMIPWAGHVNYASSKGGIMMMMKTMAQEVAALKIRINSIAPGAIRTPINKSAWDCPEAYNKLMNLVPYGRIGEVDDIGKAAVFLASDLADYITGTTLFVDGGMTLFPGFRTGG